MQPEEVPLLEALPVEALTRKGNPALAWLVIVLVIAGILWMHSRPAPMEPAANAKETTAQDRLGSVVIQLQGKMMVGYAEMLGRKDDEEMLKQLQPLNAGSLDQRLRYVVLVGELGGPKKALAELDHLDTLFKQQKDLQLRPQLSEAHTALEKLYEDYANDKWNAPSVLPNERTILRDELDWFGRLALAPAKGPDTAARAEVIGEANRALSAMLAGIAVFILLGVMGTIALVVVLLLLLTNKLAKGYETGLPYGGVYAETFALWMLLFVALGIGGHLLNLGHPLYPSVLAMIGGLAALLWPVLRGIPFRQVCRDIGWHTGRNSILEPFLGVLGYPLAFPLLAISVIIILVMAQLQHLFQAAGGGGGGGGGGDLGSSPVPAHPIFQYLSGDRSQLLLIVVLASVLAPIVEETMFRGVLQRHLREATGNWGRALSFLSSAILTSFVFAIIHPQGLFGVPLLMSLAFVFSLLREWRGTLLPAMVAHGLNNGLAIFLFTRVLG